MRFNLPQRLRGYLPALVKFVLPDTDAVYKHITDVVDNGVLVICFRDKFKHIFIILSGQIQPNYVQTVVEKSWKDTGLWMPIFGGKEDMIFVIVGVL